MSISFLPAFILACTTSESTDGGTETNIPKAPATSPVRFDLISQTNFNNIVENQPEKYPFIWANDRNDSGTLNPDELMPNSAPNSDLKIGAFTTSTLISGADNYAWSFSPAFEVAYLEIVREDNRSTYQEAQRAGMGHLGVNYQKEIPW